MMKQEKRWQGRERWLLTWLRYTIDLEGLLLKNYKTYSAAIGVVIASALGATGYLDIPTALMLSNGLLGLGLYFLRMGVKKIQDPVNEVLAKIPDIPV